MSLHVYGSLFSLGRKHEPDENKRAKEGKLENVIHMIQNCDD
jgi:hypothetical protein